MARPDCDPLATERSAIVTGGSSGIGQAIAVALAQAGFGVAVVGRSPERLLETGSLLGGRPSGRAEHLTLELDVGSESDMNHLAERCAEHFGQVDLLVASAGIGKRPETERVMPHATADLPLREWQAVLDVNLRGAFLAARAVLPGMRARRQGHILNIGSCTTPQGLRGTPFGPAYCASKFALAGLTESLAAEVAGEGIRVQAVFPGPVATRLVDQTILARPFGGAIPAEHFAAAILFLVQQPVDAVLVHPHVLPFRGAFEAPPAVPAGVMA